METDRKPLWTATVLTLFPEMFPGPLGQSLAGRALSDGVWSLDSVDIRGFARDKHRSVDDTPFGGGAGMVMRPDVLDAAITGIAQDRTADLFYAARSPADADPRAGAGGGAGGDPAVRPVRGCRPAGAGRAPGRGDQPRGFRAVGRRTGGTDVDGCRRAALARGDRQSGVARGREFRSGGCWSTPTIRGPRNGRAARCRKC